MKTVANSLLKFFKQIPDPRDPRGIRFPLPAVLTMTGVAVLCGAKTLSAIAQFGKDHDKELIRAMGFKKYATPCTSMLHNLYARLDPKAVGDAFRRWVAADECELRTISFDGKALRGTRSGESPALHLLTVYAHEAAVVLEQVCVGQKTNEYGAALKIVPEMDLKDRIVLGDAMFCQKELSEKINASGGDWIWPVKDNQPSLKEEIAKLTNFAFPPGGRPGRSPGPHPQGDGQRAWAC